MSEHEHEEDVPHQDPTSGMDAATEAPEEEQYEEEQQQHDEDNDNDHHHQHHQDLPLYDMEDGNYLDLDSLLEQQQPAPAQQQDHQDHHHTEDLPAFDTQQQHQNETAVPITQVSQTQQQQDDDEEEVDEPQEIGVSVRPPTPTSSQPATGNINANYTMPDITRTNGIGEWGAWERGFNKPRDACLDLLDNCFDATLHADFYGRVVMQRFAPNGICIINNSRKRIKDMEEILVPYNSSKGKDSNAKQDAIGENGIGLKHGCANLSRSSFALCRNDNVFSLGIIAEALQSVEGICLPSFEFCITNEDDKAPAEIEQELKEQVQSIVQLPKIAELVQKELGKYNNPEEDGSLEAGINRLVQLFQVLWGDQWGEEDYVFMLIIADLKHTHSAAAPDSTVTTNSRRDHNSMHPATVFLQEIKNMLPTHYINIPPTGFEFLIESANREMEQVQFSYWQRRLVELSKFIVHIPETELVEERMDINWDKTGYPLSVYCGFDPIRLEERKGGTNLNLRIYSRQSGRLIENSEDARGKLGLSNQGSDYGQGLTIIVDDVHGKLPLMPNKQGIAWSEQTHGETHETNFIAWVSAVSRAYYEYHKWRLGDNKTNLTTAVKAWSTPVKSYVQQQEERVRNQEHQRDEMKRLEIADLNTFTPEWKKGSYQGRFKILASNKNMLGQDPYFKPGKDTQFEFSQEQMSEAAQYGNGRKRRSRSPEQQQPSGSALKTRRSSSSRQNNIDNDDDDMIQVFDSNPDEMQWMFQGGNYNYNGNGNDRLQQFARKKTGGPAQSQNHLHRQQVARKSTGTSQMVSNESSAAVVQLQREMAAYKSMLQQEKRNSDNNRQAALQYSKQLLETRQQLEHKHKQNQQLAQQLERERGRKETDLGSVKRENESLKMQLEEKDLLIRKLQANSSSSTSVDQQPHHHDRSIANENDQSRSNEKEDYGIGSPNFLNFLREQSAVSATDTFTI